MRDFSKLYHFDQAAFDEYYFGGLYGAPLMKATDQFDIAETQFLDPQYAAEVFSWVLRDTTTFTLLPKTTYAAKGDSWKVISADPTTRTDHTKGVIYSTQLYTTYDTPTVSDVHGSGSIGEQPPGIFTQWEEGIQFNLKQKGYQNAPTFDETWQKQWWGETHVNEIDYYVCEDADTVHSTSNLPESIDRVVAAKEEITNSLVGANDLDIYGLDRDSPTTYDAQVDVPSSAADRNLSVDMIDDILATAQKYSKGKRYIGITTPHTLNEIQKLIDPMNRFVDGGEEVTQTISGIQTRSGVEGLRLQVSSIKSSGLKIPIFTDSNIADPSGSGAGNLYFLDLDRIEIRTALPTTFLNSSMNDFVTIGYPKFRRGLLTMFQTVATQFNSHGKISYIKKTT